MKVKVKRKLKTVSAKSALLRVVRELREENSALASRVDVHQNVFESLRSRGVASGIPADFLAGVEGKDKHGNYKFSIARLLYASATGNWKDAGREKEAIQQMVRRKDLVPGDDESMGFMIPPAVVGEMIPLLRSKMILDTIGVRNMPGLSGAPFPIPRQTGGGTGFWPGENIAITASTQKTDMLNLNPITAGALTKFHRKFLKLGVAAEQFVRNDIAEVLARLIQTAFFNGLGNTGQPLGVFNHTAIQTLDFSSAAPTVILLQQMIEKIDKGDGVTGQMYWALGTRAKHRIAQLKRADSDTPILKGVAGESETDRSTLLGIPYADTTDLDPASGTDAIIGLGVWMETILGMWGLMDIDTSISAGDAFEKGMIWVRAFQDVDVAVRQDNSVCKGFDLAINA